MYTVRVQTCTVLECLALKTRLVDDMPVVLLNKSAQLILTLLGV